MLQKIWAVAALAIFCQAAITAPVDDEADAAKYLRDAIVINHKIKLGKISRQGSK